MPQINGSLTRRAIVGAAGVSLLAACTSATPTDGDSPAPEDTTPTPTPTPTPDPTPPVVVISPADQSAEVLPSTPVTVTASVGKLDSVTVTDATGVVLPGAVDDQGVWTSARNMHHSMTYVIQVTASGPDGTPGTATAQISTLHPKIDATYRIVHSGDTVGVGFPVSIQFDSAVMTPEMRAEVEKRVTVTSEPATEGAWGWLDNRQLMWRPRDYWAPGTVVTVDAPLAGVQTGDNKWVGADQTGNYAIGDAMISYIDIPGYTMTVTRNGETLRTIPVSNGKPTPRSETRSGTKVIIERAGKITMDSATVGIPEGQPGYYKIDTQWNLRVTWTGEFLHSAPWSVGSQGRANVSNGCTNMSPANAQWMYENSKVGDVVQVTGSGRAMAPTDGIGVWVFDFDQWKAQSAIPA